MSRQILSADKAAWIRFLPLPARPVKAETCGNYATGADMQWEYQTSRQTKATATMFSDNAPSLLQVPRCRNITASRRLPYHLVEHSMTHGQLSSRDQHPTVMLLWVARRPGDPVSGALTCQQTRAPTIHLRREDEVVVGRDRERMMESRTRACLYL
jgi:hypothetical protein